MIDDRNAPTNYQGPFLFTDPDGAGTNAEVGPFPYRLTERVTLRNVTTSSGKTIRTSPDGGFSARVRVVTEK